MRHPPARRAPRHRVTRACFNARPRLEPARGHPAAPGGHRQAPSGSLRACGGCPRRQTQAGPPATWLGPHCRQGLLRGSQPESARRLHSRPRPRLCLLWILSRAGAHGARAARAPTRPAGGGGVEGGGSGEDASKEGAMGGASRSHLLLLFGEGAWRKRDGPEGEGPRPAPKNEEGPARRCHRRVGLRSRYARGGHSAPAPVALAAAAQAAAAAAAAFAAPRRVRRRAAPRAPRARRRLRA
jgi:hypothetical protein